ncbi:MAG: DNA (cytosine-5-)-methyltransferase [Chitinophagaceae bacterium]|nr:DNA (cytosine-5-)-methyltransferase [Chitinophagaceae bacterium]
MNYIDLFAGAGGLSEGFIKEGFTPVAHVEMDKAACFSLKTRAAYHYLSQNGKLNLYVKYLKGELDRRELYDLIPEEILDSVINMPIGPEFNDKIHKQILRYTRQKEVDLIIGGPPCQAYSLVGRARSENNMEGDPRNYLYKQYAKYLEKYNPKMFVFENVLGLLSAKKGEYLRSMEKLFDKKGYKMQLFSIEANDFGVLQNRKRIIILGWKDDFVPNIPDLEKIKLSDSTTVHAIFQDLPTLQAGTGVDKYQEYTSNKPIKYLEKSLIRNKAISVLTQHVSRPHTAQDKEIYRIAVNKWKNERERLDYNDLPDRLKTHKNRHSFVDRFKVVAEDLMYSQTVVAHIAKDGHYYIHPDLKQNRSISVREAARLQSFPDDYYFEGVKEKAGRTAAFKQIGNAVPPLMAGVIAKEIKQILK